MSANDSFDSPQSIYSTLEEIDSELVRRREDKVLAQKIKDFFGVLPHFLKHEDAQYAFFSRPIITPNKETEYFLDLLPLLDMEPLFLEYPGKFVAKNKEKRFLAKMPILSGFGKKYGAKIKHHKIVDFNLWEGEDLSSVKTKTGHNLLKYHRRLFLSKYPDLESSLVDFTDWFNDARSKNGYYYLTFLALFIRNGVLFENFLHEDSEEVGFFEDKVLPSFKMAMKVFGVKPLIFPLLPIRNEKSVVWLSYENVDI